ncbi:Hypothetical_protein [Hexamita inflata]|uniref:Hypothetical_protein n=1 Tax=Hexamita inflata TaxID=28002 RepID=A0AA86UZ82_9EUKA|nr:Hypothetical protein HINF_LOCUS61769 [Hexamita inflata]
MPTEYFTEYSFKYSLKCQLNTSFKFLQSTQSQATAARCLQRFFYNYSRINFTFLNIYQMTTKLQELQEEYDKYMEIANSFKEEPELHKDECKCSTCQRQKYYEAYYTAWDLKIEILKEKSLIELQEYKEQSQKKQEQRNNAPKRIVYSSMASSYQDQ